VLTKPRGTRDFTPEEMFKRKYIEDSIRTTFNNFGYKEVQTPIFEKLELFTAKSGETIIEEIYSFTDKGGRELALRPELTAPVIRFYIEKLQMEPKPLKLFYFGNCFRYDRPQKGRYREFKQAGCEIIGADTPESYAELITVAYKILKNIGLKNIKLNIGNLNVLSSMFKILSLNKENQKYLTPLIDKSLYEDIYEALQDFGAKNKEITEFLEVLQTSDINKVKNFIKKDEAAMQEISKLEEILDLLKTSFDVKNFQIKMSIVRGLDYYKDVVFEIEAPDLGAEKQLCGGGAYELISLFGGKESPTAGFAIGFDRTILALENEKFKLPAMELDTYVIPVNDEMIKKSLEIAHDLRNTNISTDIDLLRRGISKSLKYASAINARKVIIIGPKELEKNSVTIRDMKTGEQETVEISNIKNYLS